MTQKAFARSGWRFFVAFMACVPLLACSDDESEETGATDAGLMDGGGTDTGAGGAIATTCNAPPPLVLVANIAGSNLLPVMEDFLYQEAGVGSAPGSIRRVASAGGIVTTLFTAAAQHVIAGFMVNATDIVFVDDDYTAAPTKSRVMKMPIAGGTPTQVGIDLAEARVVGIDNTSAYVVSKAAGKQRVARIALGGGGAATIADVDGSTMLGTQLVGAKLYFTQTLPMMTGAFGYNVLDVSAAAALPTPFGVVKSGTCLVQLQPVVFGSTAVVCTTGSGGSRVVALDLDGMNPRPLIERANSGPFFNVLASAGDTFYMQQLPSKAQLNDGALYKMELASPNALVPVACGRGVVKNRLFRSVPTLDSVEIAVGPTRVAWIEQRQEATGLTFTLFTKERIPSI